MPQQAHQLGVIHDDSGMPFSSAAVPVAPKREGDRHRNHLRRAHAANQRLDLVQNIQTP